MRVFGTRLRPGKSSVVQRVLERLEDGADLRLHHDGAVEVGGGVGEVFVEAFPADGARLLAAAVHVEALLDFAALLGDLGADAIDFVADIHAIGDGALVVVFHHEVLIEEADGLFARRGGQADEEGVEVFEHLPPQAVDGAMAFIDDDEVEGLDGDGGIVGDVLRAAVGGGDFVAGFFVDVLVEFLAAQDGVKALDGADGDAGDGIEVVRGEMLDVVNLGELAAGVGRDELIELALGLASEIRAVHEKEDALCTGVLDEPVGEAARGVGLARAGGHLDERARVIGGEGAFEIRDALDLAGAEIPLRQRVGRGHGDEPGAEGVGKREPRGECLRAMEGEHAAGTGRGIAFVAEEGLDARWIRRGTGASRE